MFKKVKDLLMIYFFLTLLTLLLDNIDMIVQFSRFAAEGNDFSEIVLVCAIMALMATNYIWFAWIWHAKLRMPTVMKGITAAFLGFSNTLVADMIQSAKNSRKNAAYVRDQFKNRR